MEVPERQKSSEDLIREAKESLVRPPTKRESAPSSRLRPEPMPASPPSKPSIATQSPRALSPSRSTPTGTDQQTKPVRTGLWKFIAIISLGWAALVSISIVSSMFAQPEDAFELALGGVVIALLPFLIGVYALRRGRRERAADLPET